MSENKSLLGLIGVAILGTITLICANGMTFSGITIFDKVLLDDFGWTKGELKLRDLINLVGAALIMPFIGAVIDKVGAKRTIIIGLTMIAALYYAYGFIQSEYHMYAIHVGFAVAVSGAGTLAVIIMISQRIKHKLGTAIGIALAGTSAGGIVIPLIGEPLLANLGWRSAFQWQALLPLVVVVLLFIFLKPVKKNTAEKEEEAVLSDDTAFNFRQAVATPVFWAICFAGIFCFYAIMAIISNLFLYLTELGYSQSEAKNTFAIFFGIILVAKLCSGFVADFINEHKLFKIQLLLLLIGTAGMAMNTETLVWPSLIAVGLGWGGLYTLFNYIIITTFGVKSAGKIGGVISFFESVGSGVGAWLTAYISDKTGDYSLSFWLVVVLLSISFVISFFIKPVKKDMKLETAT